MVSGNEKSGSSKPPLGDHSFACFALYHAAGPADGAIGESHANVKATCWPWLAIHDSSQLRELPCRSDQRFFPWVPEAFGHQASAVRADVSRNGPFGKTRLLGCEVHAGDHGGAFLNSAVQEQLATTERWSRSVHSLGQIPSIVEADPALRAVCPASSTASIPFGYKVGNRGKA